MGELRIGDTVAVTARITSLRGDGSYGIEPVGFDYDTSTSGGDPDDAHRIDVEVDFYTVDEPKLVQHGFVRGDQKFAGDGERWVYHKDLGSGLHLMNRADAKQHLASAWAVMDTGAILLMFDEPPVGAGRGAG